MSPQEQKVGCAPCRTGYLISVRLLDESSLHHVPQDHMAIGVRKIRPLTNLKLLSALGIFALWRMDIATEDFMMYNAGLVVFPSLVEVFLEIRNFLRKHRRQRTVSKASTGVALQFMSGTGGGHANIHELEA